MYGLVLAFLIALGSCTAPGLPEPSRPMDKLDVAQTWQTLDFDQMVSRTVKIEEWCIKPGEFRNTSYGSGVVIGDGVIATAAHVVDNDACFYFVGDHIVDKVVRHKDYDAAVIYLELDDTMPSAYTVLVDAHLGQNVVVVGHPNDKMAGRKANLTVTRGNVAAFYTNHKGRFRFTAPVLPGSSGGPIFDESGYLVGITTRYWYHTSSSGNKIPTDGHYYGVYSKHINDLLKE
jgi:S1-C subfamily serine protease